MDPGARHRVGLHPRLRAVAPPHLQHVVDVLDESANVSVRTGDTARFIASAECTQLLRVGNREDMVFAAPTAPRPPGLDLDAQRALGPAPPPVAYVATLGPAATAVEAELRETT